MAPRCISRQSGRRSACDFRLHPTYPRCSLKSCNRSSLLPSACRAARNGFFLLPSCCYSSGPRNFRNLRVVWPEPREFRRAKEEFDRNYTIPQTPPPIRSRCSPRWKPSPPKAPSRSRKPDSFPTKWAASRPAAVSSYFFLLRRVFYLPPRSRSPGSILRTTSSVMMVRVNSRNRKAASMR